MTERMPRFELRAPASVQVFPNGGTFDAEVANVSERGLLVTASQPGSDALLPGEGAQVGVEVRASDEHPRIQLLGVVRWRGDDRFGVKIIAMPPHHCVRFERILEEARRNSARPPAPS